MNTIFIHSKQRLEEYLLKHRALNFYHLGDLDDFFWPYTTWFGLEDEAGELRAVNLLYSGVDLPVLLAITNDNQEEMLDLLDRTQHLLPRRFYSHLSPGLETVLDAGFALKERGLYYKMSLTAPKKLVHVDTRDAVQLGADDVEDLKTLYEAAYPGNWFDARMLETGAYFGLHEGDVLIAVAGIHVYSPVYKIAALGNITVLPDRRGQGFGRVVTAGLCKHLLKTVDVIGLNVSQENEAAFKLYQGVGFEVVGEYGEWMVEAEK